MKTWRKSIGLIINWAKLGFMPRLRYLWVTKKRFARGKIPTWHLLFMGGVGNKLLNGQGQMGFTAKKKTLQISNTTVAHAGNTL